MNNIIFDKILAAAVQAPSGDNVQPWRFEFNEDQHEINLYNLPEIDHSYYNFQQSASFLAHGAVLENLAIAAQHLGFNAEIELFPEKQNFDYVARIILSSNEAKQDPLYDAIFTRNTNRFPYQQARLTEENISSFYEVVSKVANVKSYFIFQRKEISKLARVLMVNDKLVFEREDIHRYLFSMIRWNQAEIDAKCDGMPVDTLGLNLLEKLSFPLMRYWRFVKAANYVGLSQIIGLKCWYNCFSSSMLGFITVANTDACGFVQAGRAMQRVWLEATRQGLACQPIIGLPLLIFRLKQNALEAFTDKQRESIQTTEKNLFKLIKIDSSESIAVGFRFGLGKDVPTKTKRKHK